MTNVLQVWVYRGHTHACTHTYTHRIPLVLPARGQVGDVQENKRSKDWDISSRITAPAIAICTLGWNPLFYPGASVISSVKLELLQLLVLWVYNRLLGWSRRSKKEEKKSLGLGQSPVLQISFRGKHLNVATLFILISQMWIIWKQKVEIVSQLESQGPLFLRYFFLLVHLQTTIMECQHWNPYIRNLFARNNAHSPIAVSTRVPGLYRKS